MEYKHILGLNDSVIMAIMVKAKYTFHVPTHFEHSVGRLLGENVHFFQAALLPKQL
jgi:hypothetical protein